MIHARSGRLAQVIYVWGNPWIRMHAGVVGRGVDQDGLSETVCFRLYKQSGQTAQENAESCELESRLDRPRDDILTGRLNGFSRLGCQHGWTGRPIFDGAENPCRRKADPMNDTVDRRSERKAHVSTPDHKKTFWPRTCPPTSSPVFHRHATEVLQCRMIRRRLTRRTSSSFP